MKSRLHLNYSVSSSLAFTAKEKTIDCKEDSRKKSKYLEKKRRDDKSKSQMQVPDTSLNKHRVGY